MMPISGTAALMARTARHTRLPGLTASLAASSRKEGSVLGNSAMAGMPSAAASSAALTARSTDSRSTPGMAATGVRARVPSMRKIGQIRSSVVSEVWRTSRRDQSVRRLRRIRVAGKPGPLVVSAARRRVSPARYATRPVYLWELSSTLCRCSPIKMRQTTICASRLPMSLAGYGLPFRPSPIRNSSPVFASSYRDGSDPCGLRWRSDRAPCRNGGRRLRANR